MSELIKPTRRGFLRLLAGAGVVMATNPVHFLPPIGGWRSGLIVSPIDPVLENLQRELAYRASMSFDTLWSDRCSPQAVMEKFYGSKFLENLAAATPRLKFDRRGAFEGVPIIGDSGSVVDAFEDDEDEYEW